MMDALSVPSLRDLVTLYVARLRGSVSMLRGEASRGVVLRQSLESKTLRADLLESQADTLARLLAESSPPIDASWFDRQFDDAGFCRAYITEQEDEYRAEITTLHAENERLRAVADVALAICGESKTMHGVCCSSCADLLRDAVGAWKAAHRGAARIGGE